MTDVYDRTALARQLARQLLNPRVLDLPLRSGLFLSGPSSTATTAFLAQDLTPALESGDFGSRTPRRRPIVIYVDLRSEVNVSAAQVLLQAVRTHLRALAAGGFRFKFELTKLGGDDGATLAQAFCEVVEQAQTDLILIVDEVQECLKRQDAARSLMQALKAARDAVNLRPGTPGYFLFVGAGSDRTLVQEMTVGNEAAFAGATFVELLDAPPPAPDPARPER